MCQVIVKGLNDKFRGLLSLSILEICYNYSWSVDRAPNGQLGSICPNKAKARLVKKWTGSVLGKWSWANTGPNAGHLMGKWNRASLDCLSLAPSLDCLLPQALISRSTVSSPVLPHAATPALNWDLPQTLISRSLDWDPLRFSLKHSSQRHHYSSEVRVFRVLIFFWGGLLLWIRNLLR